MDAYDDLDRIEFEDEAGRRHVYEWINDVQLNDKEDSIHVNFLRCIVMKADKSGKAKIVYRNSWVTDIKAGGIDASLAKSRLCRKNCKL